MDKPRTLYSSLTVILLFPMYLFLLIVFLTMYQIVIDWEGKILVLDHSLRATDLGHLRKKQSSEQSDRSPAACLWGRKTGNVAVYTYYLICS